MSIPDNGISRNNLSITNIDLDTLGFDNQIATEGYNQENYPGSDITPRDYFFNMQPESRLSKLFNLSQRTLSPKLSELIGYMYYDLKAMYE